MGACLDTSLGPMALLRLGSCVVVREVRHPLCGSRTVGIGEAPLILVQPQEASRREPMYTKDRYDLVMARAARSRAPYGGTPLSVQAWLAA